MGAKQVFVFLTVFAAISTAEKLNNSVIFAYVENWEFDSKSPVVQVECDVLDCTRRGFCHEGQSCFIKCVIDPFTDEDDCNPHQVPKGHSEVVCCGDWFFNPIDEQCSPWECLDENLKKYYLANPVCSNRNICEYLPAPGAVCSPKYIKRVEKDWKITITALECKKLIWNDEIKTCGHCQDVKGCEGTDDDCKPKSANSIFH